MKNVSSKAKLMLKKDYLYSTEFAGKPDEDAVAHLLQTNNWMDIHAFPENVKVQNFFLTSLGEARLWYESLRPIALDLMIYKLSLDSNIQR